MLQNAYDEELLRKLFTKPQTRTLKLARKRKDLSSIYVYSRFIRACIVCFALSIKNQQICYIHNDYVMY